MPLPRILGARGHEEFANLDFAALVSDDGIDRDDLGAAVRMIAHARFVCPEPWLGIGHDEWLAKMAMGVPDNAEWVEGG